MADQGSSLAAAFSDAERLSLALQTARLGDWSWDSASDIVTPSPRAADIYGIPPGPILTRTELRDLLHPDDRERVRLAVDAALAERRDYDIEYRITTPAGVERWVAAHGRVAYESSGAVLGLLGLVQDISEQVRASRTHGGLELGLAIVGISSRCTRAPWRPSAPVKAGARRLPCGCRRLSPPEPFPERSLRRP